MQILCCYLLVLLAYAPGLWVVGRSPAAARLPLVAFSFVGLFVFNALGSVAVMRRTLPAVFRPTTTIPPIPLMSFEYVAMLVLQAAIFYGIAGLYLRYRASRPPERALAPRPLSLAEQVFPWIALAGTLLILAGFFATGGRAPLFDLLSGRITCDNILEYRACTYGRPDFWFYRLGFLVLPAMLAAFVLARSATNGRFAGRDAVWIGLCFVPPLLLGEKSGILYIVAVLLITAGMNFGARGLSLSRMLSPRFAALLLLACIPTIFAYKAYYRPEREHSLAVCGRFVFRIAGVYSESLAAVVPLVDTYGQFGGRTLPTIRGLLPHKRFDIEAALHAFLWHGGITRDDDGLPGSVSVSAAGEGYVNFGWAGFVAFAALSNLTVVVVQELLLRLRMGLIASALSAWYAWLSMMLATTGLFSTLVSLVHTGLLAAAILLWAVCRRFDRLLQ